MLSALYAELARARRARFSRPGRRRRLRHPVVSVGNLSVGGRGKTPAVAHVVEVLKTLDERPAVLTRGYRRRAPQEGVVVVHDGRAIRADLDRAGDEPLMLARALGTTPVLVCPDRYSQEGWLRRTSARRSTSSTTDSSISRCTVTWIC